MRRRAASRRSLRLTACAMTLSLILLPLPIAGCGSKPQVVSGDATAKHKREMLQRYQDSFKRKGEKPASSGVQR